jgi:DNA-binding NarL/FixJ family response regulator
VIPYKQGRDLAALIPGAQFVPLESKNHVLLDDEPAWTRFLEEVRYFVGTESRSGATTNAFSELTSRERDVLNLIAQGLDNNQIAAHLVISDKTVRNHITSIFSKMHVSNRAQAIVQARDAGLGRGA